MSTGFEEIEIPIKPTCTLREACEWVAFGYPPTDEEFKNVYRNAYPYQKKLLQAAKDKLKVLIKTQKVAITGRYAFFFGADTLTMWLFSRCLMMLLCFLIGLTRLFHPKTKLPVRFLYYQWLENLQAFHFNGVCRKVYHFKARYCHKAGLFDFECSDPAAEFEEGDIPVPDWQTLRLKRYRKLFGKETSVEDARYPVITYGTMGAIADFRLDLKRNRVSRFLRGFAEIEVDTKELMRVYPPVNPPLFKYEEAKPAEKKSVLPPLLALVAEVIEENSYTADNIPENKVVERALIQKAKEKGFEFASENQIQEAARLANGWGLQTVGRRGKGRPAKR